MYDRSDVLNFHVITNDKKRAFTLEVSKHDDDLFRVHNSKVDLLIPKDLTEKDVEFYSDYLKISFDS
jgi:hypothetical protein